MTSTFKATTTARHRALLAGLARAGYNVSDGSRLATPNRVQVEHDEDQTADLEAVVREIDPHAVSVDGKAASRGGGPTAASRFKATTTGRHRALLERLAESGYEVSNASRLGTANVVQVRHTEDQAGDVETIVRSVDPHAQRMQ